MRKILKKCVNSMLPVAFLGHNQIVFLLNKSELCDQIYEPFIDQNSEFVHLLSACR